MQPSAGIPLGIPQVPATAQELGPGPLNRQKEAGLQGSLPPGTDILLSAIYRPTED